MIVSYAHIDGFDIEMIYAERKGRRAGRSPPFLEEFLGHIGTSAFVHNVGYGENDLHTDNDENEEAQTRRGPCDGCSLM